MLVEAESGAVDVGGGRLGEPVSVNKISPRAEVSLGLRRPAGGGVIIDGIKVVGSLEADSLAGGGVVGVASGVVEVSSGTGVCVNSGFCTWAKDVVVSDVLSSEDVDVARDIEVVEVENEVEVLRLLDSVMASLVESSAAVVETFGSRPSAVEAGESSSMEVVLSMLPVEVALLRGTAVHFLPSMEVKKAPLGSDMTCQCQPAIPVAEKEDDPASSWMLSKKKKMKRKVRREEEKYATNGLGPPSRSGPQSWNRSANVVRIVYDIWPKKNSCLRTELAKPEFKEQ